MVVVVKTSWEERLPLVAMAMPLVGPLGPGGRPTWHQSPRDGHATALQQVLTVRADLLGLRRSRRQWHGGSQRARPAPPHWQLVTQFCSRGHMAERGRLSSRATFSGGSTFFTGHFFAFAPCPSARRPTRPGSLLPAARGWHDVRGPRTVSPDTTPPAPHPALAAHRPRQFAPARTVHGRGWRD